MTKIICIGGTGGSGTRALANLCKKLGYDMGDRVNVTMDSMAVVKGCISKWVPVHLSKDLSDEEERLMADDFIGSVKEQFIKSTNTKRVIKNPRSIFLMPRLHQLYPNFKYLHLVRDGRSVAFNTRPNKKYTEQYASFIFDDIKPGVWSPEIAIRVWSKVNSEIYEYGVKYMGDNYLLVRYEDLCNNDEQTYTNLSNFLGLPSDSAIEYGNLVTARKDIYKWKNKKGELIKRLEKAGHQGLKNFVYFRGLK